MSCPASAGAAETANGAVERMVLLGLTSRIIPNFAAMRSRRGRNQAAAQSAVQGAAQGAAEITWRTKSRPHP